MLLSDDTILPTDLPKVVDDDRETGKPQVLGQPGRIDNLVDSPVETQLRVVTEEANQGIVDKPGVGPTFFIVTGIGFPAVDMVL